MNAPATIDHDAIEIPPHVLDALDYCRSLVDGPTEDLDRMFKLGAAAVFRTIVKADPHRQRTIDALDLIGEQAGLFDIDHRQSLLSAGAVDAQKPAPAGKAPAIITPVDLETFFAGGQLAIAEAPDRDAKWQEFAAAVRGKLLTMEIGRNVATANLRRIAVVLDLCPAAELDAKVTAALDGTVTPPPINGHTAALDGMFDQSNEFRDLSAKTRLQITKAVADSLPVPAKPALLSKTQFLAGYTKPDWLWDGILQRRFVYSLTAKTGDGKTAVAVLVADCVAANNLTVRKIGLHEVDAGNVIYFAGENPDDLRNRMIASDHLSGRDSSQDRISIISGTFSIDAMRAECEAKAATLPGGKVDLVIVDTSAAYFLGDDENNNPQMGAHARNIRSLTTLPGGPCVVVLCHPVKNASEQSALLPRGGGAFIAEMDGNLTLWRTDDVTELWHTGKLRGPGFEPIAFRLEPVLCPALIDTKGRMSPTVRAVPITDTDKEADANAARSDEDQILVAMLEQTRPIAGLATACNWVSSGGGPQKSKVHRIMRGLEKSGHVKKGRGDIYELTDRGSKSAKVAVRASAR